jgi:RNA polymerase sigma-70 factor (ECF subfamily)
VETDAALLRRAKRGEETALLTLYQRHRMPAFRFAYRLTGSAAEAEYIVQECFLSILGRESFDAGQASLRTYLFGIVRHLASKRSLRMECEREDNEADDRAGVADPLRDLLTSERAAMVEQAVAALPLLQREALIMFEYEEMSLEEIAEITGAEVNAVKPRLFRARESLRRRLVPLLALFRERGCG